MNKETVVFSHSGMLLNNENEGLLPTGTTATVGERALMTARLVGLPICFKEHLSPPTCSSPGSSTVHKSCLPSLQS